MHLERSGKKSLEMPILPDHDVQGQFKVLLRVWMGSDLLPYWKDLALAYESFDNLGISADAPNSQIYEICQARGLILITGNRNREDPDSLEQMIQTRNKADSLPVITISAPDQFSALPDYAQRVAEKILDYMSDLDKIRGTGRLFVP